MKLIKAKFKNFRLLKDLTLDFSTDEDKKLTVIRAANETGKTTCLYGLMWGLFGGRKSLGSDYVLAPKDVLGSNKSTIDVSVEIEFSQQSFHRTKNGTYEIHDIETHYKLIRSCKEVLQASKFIGRSPEVAVLYKVESTGLIPLSNVDTEEILNDALPVALKDVYFTDGDSALAFIEASITYYKLLNYVLILDNI